MFDVRFLRFSLCFIAFQYSLYILHNLYITYKYVTLFCGNPQVVHKYKKVKSTETMLDYMCQTSFLAFPNGLQWLIVITSHD